ncbi:extracellular solute-binding protein [Brachybacterium sp. UMB0905]|uniref:extracellular solute-binding protein n=1 Tax=Brachybacterium sp. UMB0905 TaxID=2069310 RepID=UPI000C8065F4|nr:extracellular solute-binding protein [Brachybacterium sp. UMB0905]PMC76108.1 ABC transporter substrate-binding protein [Brachybacterium sp. UMB0905]
MARRSTITRRALLGAAGLTGIAGAAAAWPRLTGRDIPGRGEDALTILILGTAQDAAGRQVIADAFMEEHPDIPVLIQSVQATDWGDFFAKILTMVASGTQPDVVYTATEGAQLFAERLALPLDDYIARDADQMHDYFDDVHPSLIEAFMYKGSLYQLPLDFNAANMYLNLDVLERNGLEMPGEDWTKDDFTELLRGMHGDSTPYYWTNRLFGGIVPWLYVNDTSFLTEEKADGAQEFWSTFYPGEERSGGYLWAGSNAADERVHESFEHLRGLVQEGLAVRPEEGGGNTLVGLFASGRIGTTPAGGYWVQGLSEGGMSPEQYDVQFFPKWRTQRHQFGAAGYAVMRTTSRADQAWEWIKFSASKQAMELAFPTPATTPTRRSMVNDNFYTQIGPENWSRFYDTLDRFPTTGPIPAPPQQAAVETALIRHVSTALSGGPDQVQRSLQALDRDLREVLAQEEIR